MICATAAFYAGANRLAQAVGLRPAAQYLEMYRGIARRNATRKPEDAS